MTHTRFKHFCFIQCHQWSGVEIDFIVASATLPIKSMISRDSDWFNRTHPFRTNRDRAQDFTRSEPLIYFMSLIEIHLKQNKINTQWCLLFIHVLFVPRRVKMSSEGWVCCIDELFYHTSQFVSLTFFCSKSDFFAKKEKKKSSKIFGQHLTLLTASIRFSVVSVSTCRTKLICTSPLNWTKKEKFHSEINVF